MIAFSFGFIAQQVGADPSALRGLGLEPAFDMPPNVWEESQCIGGKAHFIGSWKSGFRTKCEQACRNTPNATGCMVVEDWDRDNCFAFLGDNVHNCNGILVDWKYQDDDPCEDFDGRGEFCMILDTPKQARAGSTCTGKDFKQKMDHFKLQSPGIKVFGCGKNKIKSECKLGCKRDYKLKNGSGEKKGKKGTKSTYAAKCIDGVVVGQQSPDMSREHGIVNPMIPDCQK